MADWDVYSPVNEPQDGDFDEEEEYSYDDYYYDDENYIPDQYNPPPKPERISASSFQLPPMKMSDLYPSFHPSRYNYNHSKRNDRLAYKHRTGDGIRKGLLNTGNDIEDALAIYNEDGKTYDTEKLRNSNADDLIPYEERTFNDYMGGGASKNIIITKVRKGTLKRGGKTTKEDIIHQKIDLDPKHYWDHISHQLMEDGQFVQGKYDVFHEAAIKERENLGIGNSAEMNSLYCFWCFYLREHFNRSMYDEFLSLAREDVVGGSHYGIECYFRFCSYGLETNWMEDVFHDFENEAMEDYYRKSYYGLEKLKAFKVNQKYDFPIPIRADIDKLISSFPTMRSFRERQAREEKAEKKAQKRNEAKAKGGPQRTSKTPASEPSILTQKKTQPTPPQAAKQNSPKQPQSLPKQPQSLPKSPNSPPKQEQPTPKSQLQPQSLPKSGNQQPPPIPRQNDKKKNKNKNKQQKQQQQQQQSKEQKQQEPIIKIGGEKQQAPIPQRQPQPKPSQRGGRRGGPRRNGRDLEWTFGRPQPASLPSDSPMQRRW